MFAESPLLHMPTLISLITISYSLLPHPLLTQSQILHVPLPANKKPAVYSQIADFFAGSVYVTITPASCGLLKITFFVTPASACLPDFAGKGNGAGDPTGSACFLCSGELLGEISLKQISRQKRTLFEHPAASGIRRGGLAEHHGQPFWLAAGWKCWQSGIPAGDPIPVRHHHMRGRGPCPNEMGKQIVSQG